MEILITPNVAILLETLVADAVKGTFPRLHFPYVRIAPTHAAGSWRHVGTSDSAPSCTARWTSDRESAGLRNTNQNLPFKDMKMGFNGASYSISGEALMQTQELCLGHDPPCFGGNKGKDTQR